MHGIKFRYSLQKDAYADLEFLNDVGGLELVILASWDIATFAPNPKQKKGSTHPKQNGELVKVQMYSDSFDMQF